MRKKVSLLLVFVVANIVLMNGSFANEYSVDKAIEITLKENSSIKKAIAKKAEKIEEEKGAFSLYLPRISVVANYTILNEDVDLDLTPVRDAITPLYETLGHYGNFSGVPNSDPATQSVMPILSEEYATPAVRGKLLEGLEKVNNGNWKPTLLNSEFGSVNLTAVMPLFTGGKIISANSASKVYVKEAEIEIDEAKYNVTKELLIRYYGLILADEAQKLRERVRKTINLHLEDAKKVFHEGMIAKSDYMQVQLYLAQSQREEKRAKKEYFIANEAVGNTMFGNGKEVIIPTSEMFYNSELQPLENYIEDGEKRNFYLSKISAKKELLDIQHTVEKGEFLPNVALTGGYVLYGYELPEYTPDYTVGITATWNIFIGGSNYRKVMASQQKEQQIELYKEKVTSDITLAITNSYKQCELYLEEIKEYENDIDFAKEVLRVKSLGFSEGVNSAHEISDAELALSKAKIEQLQAVYNYEKSLIDLLYYSGNMGDFINYASGETAIHYNNRSIN